ncbi:MAG: hypothetical protein AAGI37_07380 [Planctomycetota bacterium]
MPATRIKDAGFVQQHLEKLILAGGVLVLLIAVALFVVGKPFAIEVNNTKHPTPKEAIDVLVTGDDRLEGGLNNTEPIPRPVPPDFLEDFIEMATLQADLDLLVNGLGDPGVTRDGLDPVPPPPSRYALVFPPAPKNVEFKSGVDLLDKEFDEEATREFFKLWGKDLDEPGDFSMFVASGEFDVWDWVNRLKADPDTGEQIKIPAGIWAQRFGIAGVALLREEFDPVEGRFGNPTIVAPLPRQTRVLPDDEAEKNVTLGLAEIARLREIQAEIAQPDLPWLDGFVQVVPPGDPDELEAAGGLIQSLNDENLGPAELEIIKLEEKIEQLQERQAKRNERQGNQAPGDFDNPGSERRDPLARQIEQQRERIERLRPQALKEEQERQRLAEAERLREAERARREALRSERDRRLAGPDEFNDGLARIEGMDLQEGSTLRVWAADPSMQPGKTYRYKLLVSVINPLYAVPRLAPDQLEENAQRAALLPSQREIDAMPWIGPIQVEPESSFFFTQGRDSGPELEIYRRYEGKLRVQEFDGAPGDTIGSMMQIENELGQVQEIDMGLDSVIVDIEKRKDIFSGRTVYSLICMDADGNLFERIDTIDKSSPALRDKRDEVVNGPNQTLRPKADDPQDDQFGPGFRD